MNSLPFVFLHTPQSNAKLKTMLINTRMGVNTVTKLIPEAFGLIGVDDITGHCARAQYATMCLNPPRRSRKDYHHWTRLAIATSRL